MGRVKYLDNLKVLLVVGMIAVHVAIIYGVEGSFYLEDHETMAGPTVAVLTVFAGVGFLFGLGTFFLVAGRLSGPSLDRKGPWGFVRDRLLRLGLPVVFYVVAIAPAMEYVKFRDEGGTASFAAYAPEQYGDPAPGPTWFLEALIAFSLGYALLRAVHPTREPASGAPLCGRQVAAGGVAIAGLSFAMRLVVPYGEEHAHIQFALFPQYAILFGLGCAAGRRGWLETLPDGLRRRCGAVGLATVLALPVLLLAGGFAEGDAERDLYAGGAHWQAAAMGLVEGALAATLPLFLVGWCRAHWARQTPLLRRMAAAAYGAFILHPPVIVGLALALHGLEVPAEAKFVAVLTVGVAGSFALSSLLLRIPTLGAIIGSGPRPLARARPIAH